MKYSTYTSLDFAQDDNFIRWVKYPTVLSDQFWADYLLQNPGQKEVIREARQLVLAVQFRSYEAPEGKAEEVKQRIDLAYEQWIASRAVPSVRPVRYFFLWKNSPWARGMAATFAGLMLATVGYFFFIRNPEIVHSTDFGQTLTVVLPDSSTVVLNGNSRISYRKRWDQSQPRTVSMKGEAFFSVRHLPDDRRFLVYPSTGVAVEVLGTEFDLLSRENQTQVVLISGKVRLTLGQGADTASVVMAPGERATVDSLRRVAVTRASNPAHYAAWKDNKLIFDQTSMEEIATLLEQTYGYEVVLLDDSLKSRRFRGVFPADDAQVLIQALETYFQIQVNQQGKQITLSSKPR